MTKQNRAEYTSDIKQLFLSHNIDYVYKRVVKWLKNKLLKITNFLRTNNILAFSTC